jgi:hypothetical protein
MQVSPAVAAELGHRADVELSARAVPLSFDEQGNLPELDCLDE